MTHVRVVAVWVVRPDFLLALRLQEEEDAALAAHMHTVATTRAPVDASAVEEEPVEEAVVRSFAPRGNRGMSKYNSPSLTAPSKHDTAITGQRNARKLEKVW